MPQYTQHDFLRMAPLDHPAHDFVFALVAQRNGVCYHVGTATLIGPGFLVTAKHVLRYMFKNVAGLETDETSPDVLESDHGPDFNLLPEYGVGLDALQFLPDCQVRRYAVIGYVQIWHKPTDLMVLHIQPHPGYPPPTELKWNIPVLDLVPPQVGRSIHGYGFPDHPDHKLDTPDGWLQDYFLYQTVGIVEQLNLEENLRNFHTSMRTTSGLSGGPVFASRDGQDFFAASLVQAGVITLL